MKKGWIRPAYFSVLCLLAPLAPVSAADAPEKLTLAQAVERALERNPELSVDGPMREAMREELEASRRGWLPRVDFEQSYTGGNNPVYVFGTLLTQRQFTEANFAISSLNRPDPVDNLQTRFSAQQTIWDAGRTSTMVEAARLGLEATDRGHEEHVRHVLLAVVDAYYSVSFARESAAAARTALESAEAIVRQAGSRVESGLAVEADLLRSQAFLAAARQEDIAAGGRLDVAQSRLNRLIGAPVGAPHVETVPLEPKSYTLRAEEILLAEQKQRRPDYLRLLSEVRQAELEVRMKQAQFLPAIGAFAAWEADNPSLTKAGGTNWTAGVSLRWNLFAGGADASRLRAARQRLEAKNRQLAAMESAMALEIHSTLVHFRSAQEQVEVTQAAEAQSRESLRILKNRYDAGLATMTDLLSAESQRASARAALSHALYRHRLGYAQVEQAAGLLSPTSQAMNP